jgi:hypothetical protein
MDDRPNFLIRFLDSIGYAMFYLVLAIPLLREVALWLMPIDNDAPWLDGNK